jgi:hypothetical protein
MGATPQKQLYPLPEIFVMSFFDQIRTADQSSPVTLLLNEESITLSADQFNGKTVSQLFGENGHQLGNVTRINRFVLNGEIVPGTTVVRAGETVRGAVSSESKG